jgi:hypothetical protein
MVTRWTRRPRRVETVKPVLSRVRRYVLDPGGAGALPIRIIGREAQEAPLGSRRQSASPASFRFRLPSASRGRRNARRAGDAGVPLLGSRCDRRAGPPRGHSPSHEHGSCHACRKRARACRSPGSFLPGQAHTHRRGRRGCGVDGRRGGSPYGHRAGWPCARSRIHADDRVHHEYGAEPMRRLPVSCVQEHHSMRLQRHKIPSHQLVI